MKIMRADRVAFRAYGGDATGGVLLSLDTSLYFGVNQVGALIWELIGNGNDFDSIVSGLDGKLADPPEDLADDVRSFLSMLESRGLVSVSESAPEG